MIKSVFFICFQFNAERDQIFNAGDDGNSCILVIISCAYHTRESLHLRENDRKGAKQTDISFSIQLTNPLFIIIISHVKFHIL